MLDKVRDPLWRLTHLYSIVDKQGERVRLRLNAIQARIQACQARRKAILKARQFGVSTGAIVEQFDFTIFTPNRTSCILAHEQDSIEKLFRIVRRAYEFMDPRLRPVLDRGGGSKYAMYFPEINSRIYCDLESRSDTIHWLHVSEMAFMKDPAKLKATLQTVPINTGRVTIETTPNGMGNHFYDFWQDSHQPYEKLFFPWFLHDEYQVETKPLTRTEEEEVFARKAYERYQVVITDAQIAFRRMKQAELGALFIQEYPEDDQTCFLASGSAAMDLLIVSELYKAAPQPIRVQGPLKIFEEYDKNARYAIGGDTAEGIGGDNSSAHVFNVRTLKVAAALAGDWKPSEFAAYLDTLGRMYVTGGRPFPLLGVERNNHGHSVLLELSEHLHYPNLYVHTDERLGWKTDLVTRPIMVDALIDGVEGRTVDLRDKETLAECLTLVENNGKIEAADGKHDDRVMSAAIGLQMALKSQSLSIYDNISAHIRV